MGMVEAPRHSMRAVCGIGWLEMRPKTPMLQHGKLHWMLAMVHPAWETGWRGVSGDRWRYMVVVRPPRKSQLTPEGPEWQSQLLP